jgi:YVTN family beta-propeller protein
MKPAINIKLTPKIFMKKSSTHLAGIIAITLLSFAPAAVQAAAPQYKLLKEIPVGGEGGWDYASVDTDARRLYVSHASKVVVIDIDNNTVVGEITNTPGVHGLAPAPDLHKGFSSNGRENKSSVVDLKTLATLTKIDTGANPDGMLYEPGQQEVYLFNGRGNSATVIDAKTDKVVATIPLGGKPEFAQADPKAGRVYNNLEDKNAVAVIDTKTHTVVATWPIAPGEGASGMAFDAAHHRLFLGAGNKLMIMMDSETGKVVGSVPIGDGVDANAFDPALQLAFASCSDGTVTIAHEDAPDKLTVVQTLKTQQGSRTMTIDPKTHRIYLAAVNYAPAAAGQRPAAVPGSFKVLVFGPE